MSSKPIVLTLPYPISVNRYWRPITIKGKGGKKGHTALHPTKEAEAYKLEVQWIVRAAGVRAPLAGPIEVLYQLYPHLPQDWRKRAEKDPVWWDLTVQCIDLDNSRKVVNDAMKNIVFGDDSLIRKDPGEIMIPDGKARLVVTIKPYERAHPQDALFAMAPVFSKIDVDVPPERPMKIVSIPTDKEPF